MSENTALTSTIICVVVSATKIMTTPRPNVMNTLVTTRSSKCHDNGSYFINIHDPVPPDSRICVFSAIAICV